MCAVRIWQRKSNKLGSRLICSVTKEKFSHIGIEIDEVIYHSNSKGCHKSSIEEFGHKSETYSFELNISDYMANHMLERAISRLGDKYDFLGVLGLGLLIIFFHKLLRKIKPPVMNPKWMFCSEYSEYIILGTQSSLTPGQVADMAKSELT